MSKVRKYQASEPFARIGDVQEHIAFGGYFWFHGKPLHPSFVCGWPFHTVVATMRQQQLMRAAVTPEWVAQQADAAVAQYEQAIP